MKHVTRRQALLAAAAAVPLQRAFGEQTSRIAVEAYIFQQYAQRSHRKLGDVLDEVVPMARQAGFRNIELNAEFFAPELRERTLALVKGSGLRMPSVYSGGTLHEPEAAKATAARALELAKICQPFGCIAVVTNADPKKGGAEKTDAELAIQADEMNRMGRLLQANGFELRIHNHTPEMVNGAREWHYTLQHTDPQLVRLCLDLDWVHRGEQDPLGLLRLSGKRVREIHVRNSREKLWLEDVEDGDVDYRAIAEYLSRSGLRPLIVVELAYREKTVVTRPLEQDLARSRQYTERIFGLKA